MSWVRDSTTGVLAQVNIRRGWAEREQICSVRAFCVRQPSGEHLLPMADRSSAGLAVKPRLNEAAA